MALNPFARPNLAVTDLPPAGASDSGKVLTADETGVPYWATPSGGGGDSGVVVVNDVDGTLDKTWKEIHDSMASGNIVIVPFVDEGIGISMGIVTSALNVDHLYGLWFPWQTMQDAPAYACDSATGYPVVNDG